MEEKKVYTYLTAKTAIAARKRVLSELEELTGGKIDEARELIRQLEELNDICEEMGETL